MTCGLTKPTELKWEMAQCTIKLEHFQLNNLIKSIFIGLEIQFVLSQNFKHNGNRFSKRKFLFTFWGRIECGFSCLNTIEMWSRCVFIQHIRTRWLLTKTIQTKRGSLNFSLRLCAWTAAATAAKTIPRITNFPSISKPSKLLWQRINSDGVLQPILLFTWLQTQNCSQTMHEHTTIYIMYVVYDDVGKRHRQVFVFVPFFCWLCSRHNWQHTVHNNPS